ncbi:type IX secretion system membrane protein PorP/SprF [Myroides albus]|uniref:Type IX secretion system membrane protein PorP/SprF n=2 Tax=Flavobacteriaceae TaxID=49546 RepID=A0A6I3LN17_9FLAO|nr:MULTISPECIES: type IX secretion system membrane protein PorP/SprF [Myroides]MTG98710.1 type IX secretion system membrane protein PorP/SprF [Myroides albus]MVX35660.1 type IX secretion system membrane protein PorP/SprF [Myroides sp. LoEW2-1]UVD78793.1 type IX secretion system membrane protein PorP/SprF [Myroides albus]
MKSIIKILFSAYLFLLTNLLFAQQDPQYTQYMYNHAVINPAYVGTVDYLTIYGQYRSQWVGLEGAPKTSNFSLNSPLGSNGLSGGINFVNDRIGAMEENTISLDFGYTIALDYQYNLAFGIKGQANFLNVDYTKLKAFKPEDPLLQSNINNKFRPNVGVGIMVYSDRAYIGISAPTLLSTYVYDDNEEITTVRKKTHLYLTGGYIFDVSDEVRVKPAVLIKGVQGSPLQVDLTANVLFFNRFTLGAAYRWDAAISGLVGFQINNNLMIGYSYDADTTSLRKTNSGSHEVFMRYQLFNNRAQKVTTTRFY